jgi:purine-nucleoside phosphorylase
MRGWLLAAPAFLVISLGFLLPVALLFRISLNRTDEGGAMQPDIAVRDLVLAQTASTYGSPSASLFRGLNFAPVADFGLLSAAHAASGGIGVSVHVGGIYSSDTFYDERADLTEQLQRHGCLCVEMETAELYMLAARHKRRALSILTMSDHLLTGEALPADQRERSFGAMVDLALAAAFSPKGTP